MKTETGAKMLFARSMAAGGAFVAAGLCTSLSYAEGAAPDPNNSSGAPLAPLPSASVNTPPPVSINGTVQVAIGAAPNSAAGPTPERRADEREWASAAARDRAPGPPVDERFLHGFRVGYAFIVNYDKPIETFQTGETDSEGKPIYQSLKDKTHMRTPHQFLLGYEGMYRMTGHSWLNVILVGNVMVAGLEQSQFYPTANTLLGFEFNNSFQVGVGANLAPLKDNVAHAIVAGGWTPRVGSFYVPLHAFFIPDVDGVHRMGVTSGVTW